jgi:spermidine/putrescine-binding protein
LSGCLLVERTDDEFFRKLKANGVKIAPGNSVARDLVVKGEMKVGLTDTDDVNIALEDKQPVAMVLPDRDGMGAPLMPNMVSLIAAAPRVEAGKKLIDYLLITCSRRKSNASWQGRKLFRHRFTLGSKGRRTSLWSVHSSR